MGATSISSVGIIDGRLHIQEYHESPIFLRDLDANRVLLVDPLGRVVTPVQGTFSSTESVAFGIDEQGNVHSDRGFGVAIWFPYWEYVYEVDLTRLSEYRLIATATAHERTSINWVVRFEIDIPG